MKLLIILTMVSLVTSEFVHQMRIAAIFDSSSDRIHEFAFKNAVQSINRNR